jgi:hypothetical protein
VDLLDLYRRPEAVDRRPIILAGSMVRVEVVAIFVRVL